MFVDVAKIELKAGNGGDGKVSFHREKYIASGGPDGGDGGRGGNVIFRADDGMSTLADFRYKKKYVAENGQNGGTNRSSGKSAKDLVICVPRGTLVREIDQGRLIADVSDDIDYVIARGGRGGWGNSHFATATRQTPRFAKPGILGDTIEVKLELKLLADVGIVGFPNVGKSTLISVVSDAKPIIADYHFTTLIPVLGVVRLREGSSFVMADIPGIIEGAKDGVGLGHQFLRHVERCRMFVHMVDVSGSEGRDPINDFETINKEIAAFNKEMVQKPMLVVGNKCDLTDAEHVLAFRKHVESKGYTFVDIMAPIRHNVDNLLQQIEKMLAKLPPILKYEVDSELIEESKVDKDNVEIIKTDDKYIVHAQWIDNLMRSVNFDDYESLQYFYRTLLKYGIIDRLRCMGAVNGDTVKVCDMEFNLED